MSVWKTVELGEVAEFVRGINFKPDDVVPVGTPGSVACMRTKNVQSELDCSDVWGVDERFVRRDDQFLETGDILVSSANSWNLVGKCCWIPELPWRATFGGFVSVLRPHRTKTEPRFLYRWFSSDRIQTTLRSFGQQTTNISNLNTDRCLRLPLPLPPMSEQRRIAEVLDRAETLRAKRRAVLAQLDTLTQSIFLDLFGNPRENRGRFKIVPLGELCVKLVDGTHKTPSYTASGVPFITVKNMAMGALNFEGTKFISEDEHALLTRHVQPERGDILVSKDGTIGVACPVETDRDFSIFVSVALLKIKHDIVDQIFLTGQFRTDWIQSQIRAGTKGIAIRHLHLNDFKKLRVLLPALSLQKEFVRRVVAVEKLKTTHRASLDKMDTLFSVLQDRAFRREL